MDEISISIIIPVYQVSAYIERCLQSVIRQTYNRFECILVDDASTDDSMARCERLIAAYEGPIRFRILRHDHNRGPSAARNTGIVAATGDYLLFIDSDDMVSDDCVEKLMAPILRDPSVELVMGGMRRFADPDHQIPSHIQQYEGYDVADYPTAEAVRDLYLNPPKSIPPSPWNKLTSRHFINSHHLRFTEGLIWEDVLWTFFEMKYLSHVYIIPEVTYHYLYRPDSITFGTKDEERLLHSCAVCEIIATHFTPGDEQREARIHFVRFCYTYVQMEKTPNLRDVSRRFSRALSWRRHPRQKLLLLAADLLPRNKMGSKVFLGLRNLMK